MAPASHLPPTTQHKELRTRIGHQILRLQHLLPPSRGTQQLIALHISVYEKLWELDDAISDMKSREPKPIVVESFTNLMSEIEGRMSTVVVRAAERCLHACVMKRVDAFVRSHHSLKPPSQLLAAAFAYTHKQETLMEGLRESQRAQDEQSPDGMVDLPKPMITSQVDSFLQVCVFVRVCLQTWNGRQAVTMVRRMIHNQNLRPKSSPLRLNTGPHRHLHAHPALPRHQQGPRPGALYPAHRPHPPLPRRLLFLRVRDRAHDMSCHSQQFPFLLVMHSYARL